MVNPLGQRAQGFCLYFFGVGFKTQAVYYALFVFKNQVPYFWGWLLAAPPSGTARAVFQQNPGGGQFVADAVGFGPVFRRPRGLALGD